MRVAYLGPEGTFSHQALLGSGLATEGLPLPSIHEAVRAVSDGRADRALAPIENALEGSVDVTLDALSNSAGDVEIVAELVLDVRNCLIGPRQMALGEIEAVHSHPQANAQCAGFLRRELPNARVLASSSTAEAVRSVAANPDVPHAALGNRLAAELYGGVVLAEAVDDVPANQTRFVWIARRGSEPDGRREKTSLLFWGAGDEDAGWLVACLAEFSERAISLTRIESRPRRIGLGHYVFFTDLLGGLDDPAVREAIAGLHGHCEEVRVLGSYAIATLAPRE